MYADADSRISFDVSSAPNNRSRHLILVERRSEDAREPRSPRELDWSVYMARAQNGDREAYRRLLKDITPYLRFLARKRFQSPANVEDAVQDILLTVHAVRHTYDPARPFGPWLAAIAHRRIVDALRRRIREKSRELPLADERETFSASQANLSDAGMDGRTLADAIERLPAGQREAIRLLKLQELSLKEAAAASGLSVAALKVATHRAMKNLRRIFAGEGKDK